MEMDTVHPLDVCVYSDWESANRVHLISHSVGFVLFLAVVLFMKETRGSVLLTKIAKKMREETGDLRYRARIEDERGSLRSLILVSLTRPICAYILCFGFCAIDIALIQTFWSQNL